VKPGLPGSVSLGRNPTKDVTSPRDEENIETS
jgi:hypothetical protein